MIFYFIEVYGYWYQRVDFFYLLIRLSIIWLLLFFKNCFSANKEWVCVLKITKIINSKMTTNKFVRVA